MTRYDITLKKEPPRVEGLSNSRHCLLSNGCSHYYESDAGHCSRCWALFEMLASCPERVGAQFKEV